MSITNTPNGFKLDTAGQRVVVDPVTRIEGHMRAEVNIDSNNMITNAVSSGTIWRGLEVILKGRIPETAKVMEIWFRLVVGKGTMRPGEGTIHFLFVLEEDAGT